MKRVFSIFILIVVFLLAGCGEVKYPLNGVWSGVIDDGHGDAIKITLAFVDTLAILSYELGDETSSSRVRFTYENGSGSLRISRTDNKFFVNNNVLNFTHEGTPVTLYKDTVSKAAPAVLNGLWKDLEGWDMAFVNDRCYVSQGSTTDYGFYSFIRNEGSYTSRQYNAKVEFKFSAKDKKLSVQINGYDQTFSRVK